MPICSLCKRGNYACSYEVSVDLSRPTKKNYTAALEARVALLEGVLKDAAKRSTSVIGGEEPEQSNIPAMLTPSLSLPTGPLEDVQIEPGQPFVPADDAAYVLKSVNLVPSNPGTAAPLDQLDLGMSDWVPLVSLDAEHKLLGQFWDWQRMHLPYVAPVPFISAYAIQSEAAHYGEPMMPKFSGPSVIGVPRASSVKPSSDLVQFISPLLLDAMFAIAALFTGDPETSELFYKRAQNRVLSEAANPRLATVQAILIMATWELGYARAPATWTLMGVACALCVQLGMNTDATPLVCRGEMSKRLFETRNFVFWAAYISDRTAAMCMGMHPFIDRSTISTPQQWSFATANGLEPADRSSTNGRTTSSELDQGVNRSNATGPDASIDWWNPRTLGIGDVIDQALWEAIRDLNHISDELFKEIYSFDIPKRSPQAILDLVTRNHVKVQQFIDKLPTWLRSTSVIRKKENNLVYLHLFIHVTSVLSSRPFLSSHPLSGETAHIGAAGDTAEPDHVSRIIRSYRTSAFRVARASALHIMSLIRHVPLSSPCVTLPYVVYTAATILLLAPEDPVAMDGVETGISCLQSMHETGYWVNSARNARDRIRALAMRWSVGVMPKNKQLGHFSKGSGDKLGHGIKGTWQSSDDARIVQGGQEPKDRDSRSAPSLEIARNEESCVANFSGPPRQVLDILGSTFPHAYNEGEGQPYLALWDTVRLDDATFRQTIPRPSHKDVATPRSPTLYPVDQYPQATTQSSGFITDGTVQPPNVGAYIQAQATSDVPYQAQANYSESQQYIEQQRPIQQRNYELGSDTYFYPNHSPNGIYRMTQYRPGRLPHVGYASSHADPHHQLQLPRDNWNDFLPHIDFNLPCVPDPMTHANISTCYAETAPSNQVPAFIQATADPYTDVQLNWYAGSQHNFPPIVDGIDIIRFMNDLS